MSMNTHTSRPGSISHRHKLGSCVRLTALTQTRSTPSHRRPSGRPGELSHTHPQSLAAPPHPRRLQQTLHQSSAPGSAATPAAAAGPGPSLRPARGRPPQPPRRPCPQPARALTRYRAPAPAETGSAPSGSAGTTWRRRRRELAARRPGPRPGREPPTVPGAAGSQGLGRTTRDLATATRSPGRPPVPARAHHPRPQASTQAPQPGPPLRPGRRRPARRRCAGRPGMWPGGAGRGGAGEGARGRTGA